VHWKVKKGGWITIGDRWLAAWMRNAGRKLLGPRLTSLVAGSVELIYCLGTYIVYGLFGDGGDRMEERIVDQSVRPAARRRLAARGW
jgi:hypothetical protein